VVTWFHQKQESQGVNISIEDLIITTFCLIDDELEKNLALPELPWFGSLFYGSKAQEGGARRAMK